MHSVEFGLILFCKMFRNIKENRPGNYRITRPVFIVLLLMHLLGLSGNINLHFIRQSYLFVIRMVAPSFVTEITSTL